jgi:diphthamide synthase (EF-2-diphthine--ammonia ligase)
VIVIRGQASNFGIVFLAMRQQRKSCWVSSRPGASGPARIRSYGHRWAYREQFLARHDMRGLYPVWRRDTREFIRQFITLGFKAVVTCVDSAALDQSFAGRLINEDFLAALPAHVDPCGEKGEFHTFVFAGPIFKEAVRFAIGERVLRDSF